MDELTNLINDEKYDNLLFHYYPVTDPYYELAGSVNVDDKKFIKIEKQINKLKPSKSSSEVTVYTYRNLELIVDGNDTRYYVCKKQVYADIIKSGLIAVIDSQEKTLEQFPVLNKYHKVNKQQITKYTIDDLVDVQFIKEKDLNCILISFVNKNKEVLIRTLSKIINNFM